MEQLKSIEEALKLQQSLVEDALACNERIIALLNELEEILGGPHDTESVPGRQGEGSGDSEGETPSSVLS